MAFLRKTLSRIAQRPDIKSVVLLATLAVLLWRLVTTAHQLYADHTSAGWGSKVDFAVQVIVVTVIIRDLCKTWKRLLHKRTGFALLRLAVTVSWCSYYALVAYCIFSHQHQATIMSAVVFPMILPVFLINLFEDMVARERKARQWHETAEARAGQFNNLFADDLFDRFRSEAARST